MQVVSTIRLERTASVVPDGDATFREDFLQLAARIGLSREATTMLVEAYSGQAFGACKPADLVPILDDLLVLAQRTTRNDGPGQACGA
jgi:hypothetical protein